jgi:hypothetical protein
MNRYVVVVDGRYVTSLHGPGRVGIGLTDTKDDAGSWVTHESAVEAAKVVAKCLGGFVAVHGVDEPDYPRSWLSGRVSVQSVGAG